VNGPALASALASSPSLASLPPATRQYLTSAVGLGQLRGSAAFGLTLAPRTIRFEVQSTARSNTSTAGADVSGLPGQSWLALATGPINVAQIQSLLSMQPRTTGAALNLFRQRFGIDVVHDVLPALGPIRLAIQGTALPALQAGLSVVPSNLAAASRVLGAIYNRAKRSGSVSVQGTPTSFSVTKPGQPLPKVTVAEVGRRVLATFDQALVQFVSPTSTLSANPAFGRAKSALGDATRIPFFLDFSALASFTSQIPAFQPGGSDYKAQQVVQRLDYFVFGSNPAKGNARFVLGLR
jgi:hypothetical protein